MNQVRLLNRRTPNFLDCARPLFRFFDPQAHTLLLIRDSYNARITRTSGKEGLADGSGCLFLRIQSEKYTSSGPNWSDLPKSRSLTLPLIVTFSLRPSAYS